jgi:hypothetical protein
MYTAPRAATIKCSKIIVCYPSAIYLAEASKISRISPDGTCRVLGPGFSTSLFTSLVLAKVPLAIISSLPLLAPYELKSLA